MDIANTFQKIIILRAKSRDTCNQSNPGAVKPFVRMVDTPRPTLKTNDKKQETGVPIIQAYRIGQILKY